MGRLNRERFYKAPAEFYIQRGRPFNVDTVILYGEGKRRHIAFFFLPGTKL